MFLKKLVSVVLCFVLLMASVVALFPEMTPDVSAATYRTAANGPSSSYKGSKYYQHFLKIPLTGDGPTDALALALSQLGYHEGRSVSDMAGNSSSSGNYTEYNYNMGDWGSDYTYEWCATFCSWALYQSQCTNQNSINDWARKHIGDSNYVWREVGCPSWIQNLKAVGMWKYSQYYGGSYKPQPGDLIFFNSGGHIGMVVYSDSSKVYTVEGNTSDAAGVEPAGGGVFFKSYALNASYIDGYGVLPYKRNSNVVKIDYSGANPSAGLYITNVAKYVYPSETSTTASTTIPKYAMFEVTEVASNGRLKAKYTNTSGTTVEGWVLNNADRVIQLTSNVTNEKVNMTLKCVDEKGNTLKSETITGNKGASATITPPAITGYTPTQSTITVVYTSGATVTVTYKPALDAAIEAAGGTRYCDYNPTALATLRSVYDQAVAMQKNASATQAQKIEMAAKLQNAIKNTIYQETVISKGKKYTNLTASGRTDSWTDDGVRLTDGVKGNKGDAKINDKVVYSGWNLGANGTAEIVVDLGSNVTSGLYRIYTSVTDDWGIYVPTKLVVSVSNDNKTFTQIGTTDSETKTTVDGIWTNYTMTVRAEQARTERYIKFSITSPKGSLWLEEIEVAAVGIGTKDEIYVDGINTKVTNGKTVVFTPAFGDVTVAKANHAATLNIVATWDGSQNCYVVKSVSNGNGTSTPTVKLGSNDILIAAHSWEKNVTDPVFCSENNVANLKRVTAGSRLYLNNVNVSAATLGAAATISLTAGDIVNNLTFEKDYTTTAPNRGDAWDDDGKKLTDGVKGKIDVNTVIDGKTYYSGWNEENASKGFSVEVLFDLESAKESNTYKAYLVGGNWGIELPKDVISMEVYASDNANSGFELVASAPVGSAELTDTLNNWNTYILTATVDESITARYVKVVLTHKPLSGTDEKLYIWVDEVEVLNVEASEDTFVDITNIALDKDYDATTHAQYTADLTDGLAAEGLSYDANWFAFYNNPDNTATHGNAPGRIGTVVIDLDGKFDINSVKINAVQNDGSGVGRPSSVKVYLSDDGETWGKATALSVPSNTTTDVAFAIEGSVVGTASFVKVEFTLGEKSFLFINEIEVYGAEAKDDVSDPDVSDPDVSEPETSEPDIDDATNVALNKDYEAAEHGSYTANLTDGVAKDVMSYDNGWFAFYNNKDSATNAPNKVGTVVIDLDGAFDISGIKINAVQNEGSGVGLPASVKVYLSEDGETWGNATELSIPDIADTTKDVAFAIKGVVEGTASFVKVEFVLGEKSYIFFNEIEVYGEEAEDDGDVSEPDVSEPDVSEPDVSEPDVSEPDVSEPDVSEPDVSEPDVSEPDVSEPGDGDGDGDGDTTKGALGDVDFDGDVDAADYILVKRSVLKTYELTEKQFDVADIDADGDVDTADYVLVKRIVLGTFNVKNK